MSVIIITKNIAENVQEGDIFTARTLYDGKVLILKKFPTNEDAFYQGYLDEDCRLLTNKEIKERKLKDWVESDKTKIDTTKENPFDLIRKIQKNH